MIEQEKHSCVTDLMGFVSENAEFNVSVKLSIDDEKITLDNLCKMIFDLKTIQSKYSSKVSIPRLSVVKEKETELIEKLNMKLNESILDDSEGNISISFYKLINSEFTFFHQRYVVYIALQKEKK